MPEITVVVPTYNRKSELKTLLDLLRRQSLSADRFEVIVVDDCSTDGTYSELESIAQGWPGLHVMQTPRNSGGPACPRNLGWRAASSPIVAFTDDDCRPTKEWLASGLEQMASNPDWGVLQGRTLPPPGTNLDERGRWTIFREITGPSPWFEAANIFYRVEALARTSGFNERFATWGEDTELGWAVLSLGWARGFDANAVVHHDVDLRGWRQALRFAWMDQHLIELGARYPEFRAEAFWKPWAIHRQSAEFAVAVGGVLGAIAWKPLIALALPYLWLRRPPVRQAGFVRECLAIGTVDLVRLAGDLKGSIANGILVF